MRRVAAGLTACAALAGLQINQGTVQEPAGLVGRSVDVAAPEELSVAASTTTTVTPEPTTTTTAELLHEQTTIPAPAPPRTAPATRPPTTIPAPTDWAIPTYIVSCETGGTFDWYAYNPSSGASGPYQLMPLHFNGELAMNQSRAAQHAKAAELWDNGRGARHWSECL